MSDAEIYHSGPLLTIIGEKNTPETYAPPTVLDPSAARRIVRYRAVAPDNLSWIGFRFEHLTPLHFTCRRLTGGDGVLDPILCTNLLHLCLLYTANRSSYDDGAFRASFSSPTRLSPSCWHRLNFRTRRGLCLAYSPSGHKPRMIRTANDLSESGGRGFLAPPLRTAIRLCSSNCLTYSNRLAGITA